MLLGPRSPIKLRIQRYVRWNFRRFPLFELAVLPVQQLPCRAASGLGL